MFATFKTKSSELIRSPRILLLVAPFILFAPVWITGKALYWGTPSTQFIPWWWQAWVTMRSGELPLWNPLAGMGAPLLANYQSALLYPPTWAYFVLAAIGGLPLMAWGQALLVAAHLAWAGWGMGLLIRRLGKSELAQTVGGLAFGLSGYLVARAHFLSVNAAVAWLPWILLVAYELVHDPKSKRLVLKLALVLAMQWLAGHAQIAWYTLILTVAWIAFWAWKSKRLSGLGNAAIRFAIAGLLAFCFSAVQLLPTAEYLMNSQRSSQVDFAQAATYSFWPWRLIGLVAPNFYGNPAHGDYRGYGNFWEDAIYIGFLPFLLAVAALLIARKKKEHRALVVFLAVLAPVSFVFALGNNTPLYEWLFKSIPTFSIFQSPTRFSIWMVFAFALLAALAADGWQRPTERALYWSRLAIVVAVALLLGAGIGALLASQGALKAPQTFFNATLMMGVFALASAWLNLRAPTAQNSKTAYWKWLVSGLVTVDLLVAGWGLNPGTNLELYNEESRLPMVVSNVLDKGRVYIPAVDEYDLRYEYFFQFDDFYTAEPSEIRSSLLPNIFLIDGVASANNYDPLLPGRYKAFMDNLNNTDQDTRNILYSLMNVSLVESFDSAEGNLISFAMTDSLPRARWADCSQDANSLEQVLGELTAIVDPNIVIVEGGPIHGKCEIGNEPTVEITRSGINQIDISVNSPSYGWLVLSDTYYPGWQAKVNGVETTIYPADGLFRAIQLDAGQANVLFAYIPLWFYVGIGVSSVSWIMLFFVWRRYN